MRSVYIDQTVNTPSPPGSCGYNFQFHFLHNLLVLGCLYSAAFHLLSYPCYLSCRYYTMSSGHVSLRGMHFLLFWIRYAKGRMLLYLKAICNLFCKIVKTLSFAGFLWYNIERYYTSADSLSTAGRKISTANHAHPPGGKAHKCA